MLNPDYGIIIYDNALRTLVMRKACGWGLVPRCEYGECYFATFTLVYSTEPSL